MTSIAVLLNTEVVAGTDWELEEAEITPVSSPGVSSDPVFLTGMLISSPTDDGDLVVKLWVGNEFLVDSTIVVLLEVVGGLDTAGDWTVLEELGLHLVNSRESIVQRNVMLLVVDSPTFILAGLADWAWWPGAVLADINSFALCSVGSNILLT